MKVIIKVQKETANRGEVIFIISKNDKGGYFAHELGELTNWAKAFNTEEQKAHRLNPNRRIGNQYIRTWRPKPFTSINQALECINEVSKQHIQRF